jgi:DNA-binding transcriptional regulator YiaG
LKSIGDHIRAWRIENKLFQKDIAEILKVCEDSVVGWEVRGNIPTMQQMPGIIRMIGYLPVDINTSTFGGRITHYRYMLGMTPRQFGVLIPADASTVRSWENERHIPPKMKRLLVERIIKQF